MTKRHFRILFICLIFGSSLCAGTDYYVDIKTGNDLNNGLTLATPWKTMKPANEKALAGDTVFIRGGTYSTESDQYHSIIHPKNSGSPGKYITFKNYGNESVVLTGCYQPILLDFPPLHYIKVDGLRIDGGSQSTSPIHIFVIINGDYNIIQNCIMQYININSTWSRGIYITATSSYNKIINNTIRYIGKNDQPNGSNIGDGIWVDGDHTLFEYNDLSYCGHNSLLLRGRYNIARHNVIHGHIGRSAEMHSSGTENCHLIYDANVIRDSGGFTPGPCAAYGLQADAANQIIRRNEFYNNHGHGAEIWGMASSSGVPAHTRCYHNVFFKNGLNPDINYGVYGIEINQLGEPSPGAFRDIVMKNNILYKNKSVGIVYKPSQTDPNDHVDTNNHKDTNGSPGFAGESAYNFQLTAGSPCIDSGAFLTRTRASGNGTTILVEDAGYFIDGFGIVEGDLIQLQWQTQTVRVTNVDYANNAISISQPLSWSSGQGVSLAFEGAAPDIGAYEYRPPNPLTASAAASPTSGPASLIVNFTGSATGGTVPYTFNWNFGDGQTSTAQNPSHTYTASGAYTATLTVTDSQNSQRSSSVSITVSERTSGLVASIMALPGSGKAPLAVNFTGNATGGTAPYTFNWNFGDGQTSTAQNPSHTYTASGTYTATLVVKDSAGSQAQASASITATAAPVPLSAAILASPTSGKVPLTVAFTGNISGGTAPYSFSWNFGDGQTSTAQNPSHTYTASGTFTATLVVKDSAGSQAQASASITATAAPVPLSAAILASPTSGKVPLTVAFTGNISGGTAPYSFSWNFGDDQTSTAQNPSHTYTASGTYMATLVIKDSAGAQAQASASITATAAPAPLSASATASPTSGKAPLPVDFTGNAGGGTAPYTFSWNFGDGQTSTAQNPSHTYTVSGTYTATLVVSDSAGVQAQTSASIAATASSAPAPLSATIAASPTSGKIPLPVAFTGNAGGGTAPYTFSWDFGDGQTSTAQNPSHTYASAGFFIVTLTVSDSAGAQSSASVIIRAGRAKKPNYRLGKNRLHIQVSKSSPGNITRTFRIIKMSAGTMPWAISSSAGWLSCTPNAGTDGSQVAVTVDPSTLQPGIYKARLTIIAPMARDPLKNVPVVLDISD